MMFLLAGCGFQLQGTSISNFTSLGLSGTSDAPVMARAVRDELRVLGVSTGMNTPEGYSVLFLDERTTRRTVATTNVIDAAEYEMRLELDVSILKGESVLVESTTLITERVYELDRVNLSGSVEEQSLLMSEMRIELARQLLRQVELLSREH